MYRRRSDGPTRSEYKVLANSSVQQDDINKHSRLGFPNYFQFHIRGVLVEQLRDHSLGVKIIMTLPDTDCFAGMTELTVSTSYSA